MALCLVNQFYLKNDSNEARLTFILVDLAIVTTLHFIRRNFEKKREVEKLKMQKKNDEYHEQDKANTRAKRSKVLENGKVEKHHSSKGYYKTHEKRNHNPPKHNIQQPSK